METRMLAIQENGCGTAFPDVIGPNLQWLDVPSMPPSAGERDDERLNGIVQSRTIVKPQRRALHRFALVAPASSPPYAHR
ncbi:MAG TPA: hypothetical protein VFC78_00810 [Tepidisphaeraceae bacterium]|nr:hypothetical protein [Tepidisphaeraceae bacterium]